MTVGSELFNLDISIQLTGVTHLLGGGLLLLGLDDGGGGVKGTLDVVGGLLDVAGMSSELSRMQGQAMKKTMEGGRGSGDGAPACLSRTTTLMKKDERRS